MVEDVALNALVRHPGRRAREDVDLEGQAVLGRLQLAHEERQVLVDGVEVLQVVDDVGAEGADIGQMALVENLLDLATVRAPQGLPPLGDVVALS